jgi:integrase
MQTQTRTLDELMSDYAQALNDYGLAYSSQLRLLQRATIVVSQHIKNCKLYLDEEVIAAYYREFDERCYNGEMGKNHHQTIHREIDRFLYFVESGKLKMPNPAKGPRSTLLPEFERITNAYLASGDFHKNTQCDMRWVAHKFFVWLTEQGYENLSGVGSTQITQFLLHCSKELAMGSMHNIKLYMCKLYAYLYESGQSESSYRLLLSFPVNRETKVYPMLPKNDIAKMLDSIDRTTRAGKRAYAVMLLGAVLGLRACDVASLRIGDIDWIHGEIKLVQSKTAKPVVLPLTNDVGEALKDYILNGRPKTHFQEIFLRLNRPYTPIVAAVTIGEIYRDCCKAADLPVDTRFHRLRRTLGTSMISGGVAVEDASQVLGQTSIDSMKPYIATNTANLKMCALPFTGLTPKGGDVQ